MKKMKSLEWVWRYPFNRKDDYFATEYSNNRINTPDIRYDIIHTNGTTYVIGIQFPDSFVQGVKDSPTEAKVFCESQRKAWFKKRRKNKKND